MATLTLTLAVARLTLYRGHTDTYRGYTYRGYTHHILPTIYSLFTPPPLIWQVHQAAVHSCLCDNFNTAGAMTALLATCSDANSYVKVPYLSKSLYLGTVQGVGIYLGAL